MSSIISLVLFMHNLFQIMVWGCTLYLVESYIRTGSPKCWKECVIIA